MIDDGDVRHDPQREEAELRQRLAREELEVGQHAALAGLVLDRPHGVLVDAGHRQERAEPVQRAASQA